MWSCSVACLFVCQHAFMRMGPQLSSKLMNVRWYCKAISRESTPTRAGGWATFPLLQFNVKRCGKKDMSSSNNSLTLNTKKLAMTSFKFGPCNLRKYILNLMCCTPQRCWLQDTENTHNTMRNTCSDRRPLFTSLGFPELHKVACTALLSPLVIGGDWTLREALSL